MGRSVPKPALLALVPVAVAMLLVAQRQRGNDSSPSSKVASAAKNSITKRHKPKSRVRFYSLGLLINFLERDSTRKMVITALKLMQKRV